MTALAPRRLLVLVAGFTLWASAFLLLYGVNAVGCAFEWPRALHRGALLSLVLLHTGALGWMTFHCWRRWRSQRAAFVESVGLGVTIAALAATLLTFTPSLLLSLCS